MVAFTHRIAPAFQNRGGYNLRGLTHAPTELQKTARQRVKDANVKVVKKNWQVTRANKRSRGLHRKGETCFRLCGIQALLHLPKFVNWILSHNNKKSDGTIEFPCRNLRAIEDALLAKTSISGRLALKRCPACVVKDFARAYWGNEDIGAGGEPEAWAHEHIQMSTLRRLDRRLYRLTPGAGNESQQDPGEFQDRLLEACLESTDHNLPENAAWNDRFEALFIMEWETTWTCACGHRRPAPLFTVENGIGIDSLAIEPEGTIDSVAAAIGRELTPVQLDGIFDCTACGLYRVRTQTQRIDGAPDILRIKINNVQKIYGNNGSVTQVRNDNFITLDPVLDLKDYQAVPSHPAPLKYSLKSVLCHGGDLEYGHWTATVSDPESVNFINDHDVQGQAKRYLRSNPQEGLQACVMTYVKVQTREA